MHLVKRSNDRPSVGLNDFLDNALTMSYSPFGSRQQEFLSKLQARRQGRTLKVWHFSDVGAPSKFVHCVRDKARARASMGRSSRVTKCMLEALQGEERRVRVALGDAMSLNVCMRTFGHSSL